MSLFMDWSAWRTRGLSEDAEVMQWERAASMAWTNIEGESSIMPSLSSSEGRRSGCLERASGAMRSLVHFEVKVSKVQKPASLSLIQ